jgi:murein L,D-transpeptidase YafK
MTQNSEQANAGYLRVAAQNPDLQRWTQDDMSRRLLLTMAVTCGMCISCSKAENNGASAEGNAVDAVAVPVFTKQQVPSSRRSRNAIAEVAPSLIRSLESAGLSYGAPVFLRVFKEERELELWVRKEGAFTLFRTYDIVAMSGLLGPKLREGDMQAPEGFYFVTPSRMNPNSRFHLSFDLGYPNSYDLAHKRTGSALMVHGNRVSIGCFAMTDSKIEEIYGLADAALRNGQEFFRVHCFPFRMTEKNMKKHSNSEWMSFWLNLKAGYDWFEESKQPPNVEVRDKKYVFEIAEK